MTKKYTGRIKTDRAERLDKLLPEVFPQLSRRRIRALIAQGSVYIDKRRMRKLSYQVSAGKGMPVTVYDFAGEGIDEIADSVNWDELILFRDENLMVINKPVGIPSAPTRESAVHNVYQYLESCSVLPKKYYPFHRLDKDSSGVLMIPLKKDFTRRLNNAMQERQIKKKYLTIAIGIPDKDAWEVFGYLTRPRGNQQPARMLANKEKIAFFSRTKFRLLAANRKENLCLLVAKPETGRTHQIRAHVKHAGLGILGDSIYAGGLSVGLQPPHHLLHCAGMYCSGETIGKNLRFEAPLPQVFREVANTYFSGWEKLI